MTIAILGAAGRMGQMLLRCAKRFPGLRVGGAYEQAGHPALGQDAGTLAGIGPLGVALADTWPADAAAVIDFTFHTAVAVHLERAIAHRQAVVLGTTGLNEEEKRRVTEAAQRIPIVWAPNFSLGVNLLLDLVRRAATVLGPAYDAEIVEMHHRLKKDAPSGTALGLAEALAAGRKVDPKAVAVYGREGITGERPRGEIAIHALRGGDVVGDHTVIFAADGERIELAHKASSRGAFANGALHAAAWLQDKPAGLYSMRDVLGLNA